MDFPFSFSPKSSLLLIFFFNSLVFSILLLRKGVLYNHKSNKWLSALLLLFAMYITPYMLGYAGWYSQRVTREILFFVPFMQVLLIGPVVFFYSKTLLDISHKFKRKDLIHFVPALLYFIYSLVVFVVDKFVLDQFYFYADGRDKDLSTWYQVCGLTSMSFYLILSLKHYNQYKKLIFEKVSFAETILFKWIRNFMLAFLIILLLRVIFFITNPEWGEFGNQFWHYIAFSFIIFYISINGYAHAIKISIFQEINLTSVDIFTESEKEKNTVEDHNTELWKAKIEECMRVEKLYENPKLTLTDVANRLETTPKTISTTINSGFQMNFNDYINYHRVEAVKAKIELGEHKKSTLLGLALDSGFNSKATFNRAFKKYCDKTPKGYVKQIEEDAL